jgi:hypothetical protein
MDWNCTGRYGNLICLPSAGQEHNTCAAYEEMPLPGTANSARNRSHTCDGYGKLLQEAIIAPSLRNRPLCPGEAGAKAVDRMRLER